MHRRRGATLRRIPTLVLAAVAAGALAACNAILDSKERYLEGVDASLDHLDAAAFDASSLDAGLFPQASLDAAADAADAVDASKASDADADAAPTDPDLLAFWTFDEDGGPVAHDGTSNHYDLTISGGATLGGTGYFSGGALQFPALMGQATSVELSGARFPPAGTLSLWAYLDTLTADDVDRGIFDVYDESRHHFYVRYSAGDQGGNGLVGLDYASQNGASFDFFAMPRPNVPLAQWTHIVLVWDTTTSSASANFYVDGMLPAQVADRYTFSNEPLQEDFILTNGFGGMYDDIYLWKRPLSDIEVASLPTK